MFITPKTSGQKKALHHFLKSIEYRDSHEQRLRELVLFTVSIQYILKGIILNEPHKVADHPRLPMERIHEAAEVHSFLQHTATQAAASEKRLARNAPICELYIPEA